jgi:hypothetical protein
VICGGEDQVEVEQVYRRLLNVWLLVFEQRLQVIVRYIERVFVFVHFELE